MLCLCSLNILIYLKDFFVENYHQDTPSFTKLETFYRESDFIPQLNLHKKNDGNAKLSRYL